MAKSNRVIIFVYAAFFPMLGAFSGGAWADGLAVKQADLENRIKYWESQLPYCNYSGGPKFPSKYQDKDAGADNETLKCNDGDTVLLNGLLCSSGDDRGCDTVKRSQGSNGEWWRSPKKIGTPGGSETTFSNDHAAGALAMIAQKKDHDALRKWISWMDSFSTPRYCDDDRCLFKLIDCPMLDRIAASLTESNPLCDPLHKLTNALQQIANYQKQFVDIVSGADSTPGFQLVKPLIVALQKPFDDAINSLKEAAIQVESVRGKLQTFARATSNSASVIAAINAEVNDAGFARHGAAVSTFLLKKYGGINGPGVSVTAIKLTVLEPQNAFFEYVARGSTERMLDLILAKCPSKQSDAPHARFQWIWERADNDQSTPWKKTMYWDCVFVANLYKDGSIKGINLSAPPGIDKAYEQVLIARENAVRQILAVAKQLEQSAKDIGKTVEKAVQDSGRILEKASHDVGKTGQKAAQDAGKGGEKAVQDAKRALALAARDVRKTAEKAAQDTGKAGETAVQDVRKTGGQALQSAGKVAEQVGRAARETASQVATQPVRTVTKVLGIKAPF